MKWVYKANGHALSKAGATIWSLNTIRKYKVSCIYKELEFPHAEANFLRYKLTFRTAFSKEFRTILLAIHGLFQSHDSKGDRPVPTYKMPFPSATPRGE